MSATAEQIREMTAASARVRGQRAALKHEIAELPRSQSHALAADVLRNPPERVEGMTVVSLLFACRELGPRRVGRIMRSAQVSESATVGGLTDRQRGALAELLRQGPKSARNLSTNHV